MSFEFVIPMRREDLLQRAGVAQYVVDEVFPVRSLAQKLQGIFILVVVCFKITYFQRKSVCANIAFIFFYFFHKVSFNSLKGKRLSLTERENVTFVIYSNITQPTKN